MSELKWNWAYYPYLDPPEKQKESALKAGYIKVVNKDDADKVIAEKDAEIRRLKNSIAPKQSDKTIQERLNEVCEKHGVSTLQDLDWAFCESEKRHAKDCIEAVSIIRHSNHKRCLAMAQWCMDAECKTEKDADFLVRWEHRWLALAEEPTWAKFLQLIRKEAK